MIIGVAGTLMLSLHNSNAKAYQLVSNEDMVKDRIVGIETPASSGTGTIIGKKGNTYTILTAGHVIPSLLPGDEYYALSLSSSKRYRIISVDHPLGSKLDIAVATFNSPEDLKITLINRFLDWNIFAMNAKGNYWGVSEPNAIVSGVSLPTGAVTVAITRFDEFNLDLRAFGNKDGYELIYKSSTVPGMSGGPVLGKRWISCDSPTKKLNQDKDGNEINPLTGPNNMHKMILSNALHGYLTLLGIHGRSEEYHSGGRSGLSLGVPIDLIKDYLTDNSDRLGIPVTEKDIEKTIKSQYCS